MKRFLSLSAALVLSACASTNSAAPEAPNTSESAASAIAAAEAAQKQADSVGYEWRDTADMIKQAKEAAAASDFDRAVATAQRAKRQGELAHAQWQHSASHASASH